MKIKLTVIMLSSLIAATTIGWSTTRSIYSASHAVQLLEASGDNSKSNEIVETASDRKMEVFNGVRYRLDAGQSRLVIDANASGLLWFLGHNHHIAARDFTGEAGLTASTVEPGSLQMTIKTESLAETGEHFTEQQKQIINNSMHKEVLETAKYPEAIFKSTNVSAKKTGENQYEARVEGDLTLHGVTRHILIPTQVIVNGDTLRASGKFEFDRDDYKIKTHSIKWGTIRVDDDMKLSFNIVAHRY
jgi:polyisoprenoid-binding protein YceI